MFISAKAALRTSAAAFVMLSGVAAHAQAAPAAPTTATTKPADQPAVENADGTTAIDAIVVTGSRIPRPEFQGIIPGAQISGQSIQARGFNSILEALNDNVLVGPGASPLGNAGGQPASLGAAFVDLLDLGTNRTLTLVNGRRFVSGNAGSLFVQGNTTGGQVDLSVIPTELVERTDILTVGGAVAYGSDAIAGVVNVILKDNYQGLSVSARSGITSRGDGFNAQLGAIYGTNFAGGRGNVTASFQYNRDDGLQGDSRDSFSPNYIAPNNWRNGATRNPNFNPANPITTANGPFNPAATDGVSAVQILPLQRGGSILVSPSGQIFQVTTTAATTPAGFSATTSSGAIYGNQVASIQSLVGTTQAVTGGGVSAAVSAFLGGTAPAVGNAGSIPNTFTRLAPTVGAAATALPAGATAAQIINALAPSLTVPTAAADANTLALSLLQVNRPTVREYYAQNPNTPLNVILGSTIAAFLDVPNTDPGSSGVFARTAVPLKFDNNGAIIQYNPGVVGPQTVATLGSMPGGDYFDPSQFTVIRTQQDRYIANLNAKFDITDNLTLYTENSYSKVKNFALRNNASANTIASGATETAVLVMSLNNPYLTTAQQTQLIASGVPTTGPTANLFALSRTNQDITGDNSAFVRSETLRTVGGLRGKFAVGDRDFRFDASVVYGRSSADIGTRSIRDVEYALAIDAVRDPSNAARIICRSQLPGQTTAFPLGVIQTVTVREPNAQGVLVERVVTRQVSQQQINNCQPLNPFGFNQMSQAAKNYTIFDAVATNKAEQLFGQFTLATASLFDLPAGGFGVALNGELRRETLDYRPNAEQRLGLSRAAALAALYGKTESVELSAEARLPVFGENFTIPLFRNLEFTPGIRLVKQTGDAPDVQRISGVVETNQAKGKWETLITLAGLWRPIEDVLIRGNFTRSVRQPSIVELFLGNQPAFNVPTDPCGNANISSGTFVANRRANCEQEVVRLGIRPDRTSAATFLNSFVPQGISLQGGFGGTPSLLPEKGKSYTVGTVLTPRFIRGLTISADYINVEVRNTIIPTTLSNAAQLCYDSPTYNDTTGQLGINTCSFYSRQPAAGGSIGQFDLNNGFVSQFINLGALRVRSVNGTVEYKFNPADIFGGSSDNSFQLRANAYYLLNYSLSPNGTFQDTQDSTGSFFRPEWKTQLTGRFESPSFYAQWTWNWQSATGIFNGNTGAFQNVENQDILRAPAFGVHDAVVGFNVAKRFSLQLNVRNVFDKRYAGLNGFANASSVVGGSGEIDFIGRRFAVTARARF